MFDNTQKQQEEEQSPRPLNPVGYASINVRGCNNPCLSELKDRRNILPAILLALLIMRLRGFEGDDRDRAKTDKLFNVFQDANVLYYNDPVIKKPSSIEDYDYNIRNAVTLNQLYGIMRALITNVFPEETKEAYKLGYGGDLGVIALVIYYFRKKRKNEYDTTGAIEAVCGALLDLFPKNSMVNTVVALVTNPNYATVPNQKAIVSCIDLIRKQLSRQRYTREKTIKANDEQDTVVQFKYYDVIEMQKDHDGASIKFDAAGNIVKKPRRVLESIEIDGMKFDMRDLNIQRKFKKVADNSEADFSDPPSDIASPCFFRQNTGSGIKRLYVNTYTGTVFETPDINVECLTDNVPVRIYYHGRWYNEENNAVMYWNEEKKKIMCSFTNDKGNVILCSPNSSKDRKIIAKSEETKLDYVDARHLRSSVNRILKSLHEDPDKVNDPEIRGELIRLKLGYLLEKPYVNNIISNLSGKINRYGNYNPLSSPFAMKTGILDKNPKNMTKSSRDAIIKEAEKSGFMNIMDDDPSAEDGRNQVTKEICDFFQKHANTLNGFSVSITSDTTSEFRDSESLSNILSEYESDTICQEYDIPTTSDVHLIQYIKDEMMDPNNKLIDIASNSFDQKMDKIDLQEREAKKAKDTVSLEAEQKLEESRRENRKKQNMEYEASGINDKIKQLRAIVVQFDDIEEKNILEIFLYYLFLWKNQGHKNYLALSTMADRIINDMHGYMFKNEKIQKVLNEISDASTAAATRLNLKDYSIKNTISNSLDTLNESEEVVRG